MYRKPILSGAFTNFKSFTPRVTIFCLVCALLFRCFYMTSSHEKFHNEINALKNKFLNLMNILFSLLIDA